MFGSAGSRAGRGKNNNRDSSSFWRSLRSATSASALLTALGVSSFMQTALAKTTGASLQTYIGVREVLTGTRTYYVRTDGSNSNTGLANTSGGAFLTLQKAWDTVCTLDQAGYTVTIQIADGTYTGGISTALSPFGGTVIIRGNNGTPANVVISTTSANCFAFTGPLGSVVQILDLKMQTTTSGSGIVLSAPGVVQFGNVVFGACATYHMQAAAPGAKINATSAYSITAAATVHGVAADLALMQIESITVTISGTPAFTYYYQVTRLGEVLARSMTYSGSATGTRYNVDLNGVLQTGGGTASVPGNVAGATATGGQAA